MFIQRIGVHDPLTMALYIVLGVSIAKDLQVFQTLTLRAKACPEEKECEFTYRILHDRARKQSLRC